MSDIENRIGKIVEKHFGKTAEQINKDTRFVEDLGADSLATIEFIMDLEEEFDIEIPQEMADTIRTIGDAVDFINDKQVG